MVLEHLAPEHGRAWFVEVPCHISCWGNHAAKQAFLSAKASEPEDDPLDFIIEHWVSVLSGSFDLLPLYLSQGH